MSYILDALKKSQAEQTGEGAQLQLQPRQGKSVSQWLLIGLAVLLGINASVMLWFFVFGNTGSDLTNQPSQIAQRPVTQTQTAQPRATQPSTPTRQPQQQAQVTPQPRQPIAQSTPQSQPRTDPLPERVPTPIATPSRPAKAAPRVALSELPASEQTLFNNFKYSSHIFSPDDPQAGAIFVDGQMLHIGDDFKGLTVADITEFAVVFRQSAQGGAREVEVVLADQWNR